MKQPRAEGRPHDPGEAQASPTCGGRRRVDYLLWGCAAGVGLLFALGALAPGWVAARPWLETMALTAYHMVHAMWWGVAIGAVFVGLLSKIPREFIMAILGRGGTAAGLARAVGAGVLLDLCSHGILMVAARLYERGASAGQVVAFLLASPWNSFALTLVLVGLVGPGWTAAFIVLSMAIALATGWIFDRLVARRALPPNHNAVSLPADFRFWPEAAAGIRGARFGLRFLRETAVSGIKGSRMVVRWLLFGILLAAMLRALLDPSQYERFFGPTLAGLAVTVLVATVVEVCSEGSTPIAADILNRAGAPGNGFAFLMAGVATDYTEVMVIRDASRSWRLALFLPLVSVPQILAVAWLMNTLG